MPKPLILVTGANGQLGRAIQVLTEGIDEFQFKFTTKEDLSIQDLKALQIFFQENKPAYCVNSAAYTSVDKAESEKDLAFLVNGKSVGTLASLCKEWNTKLIHISTDYVFDGMSREPYTEQSSTDPINIYGASKLMGEELCLQHDADAIILRTSWLYSEFGHNFVKTILRLLKEKSEINVVNDQIGAPTYAADLAHMILTIIYHKNWIPGIFHYSNSGRISWYRFAVAIKELVDSECTINPISTAQYPTPAKRPFYSLLDTTKIQKTFDVTIPDWKDALKRCLVRIAQVND
jgi:dTDP-4-dehydrorhamnose reductase